jgi:hypothetical protein
VKKIPELDRLLSLAKKMRLPVVFASDGHFDRQGLQFSHAYFSPTKRKVWVRRRMLRSDVPKLLYTVAHEMGHCADTDKMKKKRTHDVCVMILKFFRNCCYHGLNIPKQVKWFVVGCERRAWDEADVMLDRLGISLVSPQRKQKMRKSSIRGYHEIIAQVNRHARKHRRKS